MNLKKPLLFLSTLLMSAAPLRAAEAPKFRITGVHRALVQGAAAEGATWLNTSRALTENDLKGRILLLDFWTYACINCIHVMPELKDLEEKYKDKLTVIGVHSAKFNNEKDTENIRNAIIRYGLEHPVVNDSGFLIWEQFQVQAWPSFVLINPAGSIEDVFSGEGQKAAMDEAIGKLVKKYNGKINRAPLPIALEKNKKTVTELKYPGKLIYAADADGAPALFVSDSSDHRVLGIRESGEIFLVIGEKGKAGNKDGSFTGARFNKPQGLLYAPGVLYIADTDNHVLKKADLKNKTVETIAGTGHQGFEREVKDAPALKTPLSSPWDLAFYPSQKEIAIAMAGLHELWSYNLEKKTVSVLAGSGREAIIDGPALEAALAQPSGLSVGEGRLYFADSETSSLRYFENGKVKTLIGTGLFDFGFKDGKQGQALMQHDLGVAYHAEAVYIADSYNHALRRFDLKSQTLATVAGTNDRGDADGPLRQARFNEPNAIAFANDDRAFVADTNNNRLRLVDFKAGMVMTVGVFEKKLQNIKLSESLPNLKISGELKVAQDQPLTVTLKFDKGWHINDLAPSYLALFETTGSKPKLLKAFERSDLAGQKVVLPALKTNKTYRLQGTFYFCELKAGSVCALESIDRSVKPAGEGGLEGLEIPVSVGKMN